MVDSDLNIYLYLKSLEVRAHVAEVIRLNPYLHRHQPLDEYAELQLAA